MVGPVDRSDRGRIVMVGLCDLARGFTLMGANSDAEPRPAQ